jgi:hypothetical protein
MDRYSLGYGIPSVNIVTKQPAPCVYVDAWAALRAKAMLRATVDPITISMNITINKPIAVNETPVWARKDPNECLCGIHRARCEYHR